MDSCGGAALVQGGAVPRQPPPAGIQAPLYLIRMIVNNTRTRRNGAWTTPNHFLPWPKRPPIAYNHKLTPWDTTLFESSRALPNGASRASTPSLPLAHTYMLHYELWLG